MSIHSHTNTIHPPTLVSRSSLILSSHLRLGLCVYPQPHKHHSPTHPSITIQFNIILSSTPRSNKMSFLNRLTPNDPYMGRTAPLTSKRCILYIYSTNIGTEYFKHALFSPFFFSSKCSLFHNANLFGSCIIHILYTECAKI